MKLSTRVLKNRLWKVFSEYIRKRDNGVCISCNKKEDWKLQDAGHYIAKTGGLSIYFDERNVHSQCTGCNRFRHGNLPDYALALQRRYGPNILQELKDQKQKIRKISNKEYLELIDYYKNKV